MFKAGQECKVKKGNYFVSSGSKVIIDKDSEGQIVRGKTNMIFCRVPQGGSLFFDESDLEPIT